MDTTEVQVVLHETVRQNGGVRCGRRRAEVPPAPVEGIAQESLDVALGIPDGFVRTTRVMLAGVAQAPTLVSLDVVRGDLHQALNASTRQIAMEIEVVVEHAAKIPFGVALIQKMLHVHFEVRREQGKAVLQDGSWPAQQLTQDTLVGWVAARHIQPGTKDPRRRVLVYDSGLHRIAEEGTNGIEMGRRFQLRRFTKAKVLVYESRSHLGKRQVLGGKPAQEDGGGVLVVLPASDAHCLEVGQKPMAQFCIHGGDPTRRAASWPLRGLWGDRRLGRRGLGAWDRATARPHVARGPEAASPAVGSV